MRAKRKPDLMMLLVLFVGLGIAVSGLIQYLSMQPTRDETARSEIIKTYNSETNQLVTVLMPERVLSDANGDVVNNSLQQP